MTIIKISKKNLILVIAVLLPYLILSQVQLKGTVKVNSENTPHATVYLVDANDKVVAGTVTDDRGYLNIWTYKGSYTAVIKYLGCEEWSKKVSLKNDVHLGNVELEEKQNAASSKKFIKKHDNYYELLVNANKAFNESSLFDVLPEAPGVAVVKDNIFIVGKEKAEIMINNTLVTYSGKELIKYLKSISASKVENIEVYLKSASQYNIPDKDGLIKIKINI
ncbi:hypothetical protein IMCC3317_07440 [Kordia antarctica]|uniref:TonB-dependent receptor SusC n=1 Tax=Kordia antarctica TaxID=1218801 RepID=A0A7L4ZF90_9FLAO|nr:carboxypeptidase-like regulatory domain-containing protein [Kordia antarctica]QHI35398.1 hypothetical protein IMCC3317_07440 [Kordia antarctica]